MNYSALTPAELRQFADYGFGDAQIRAREELLRRGPEQEEVEDDGLTIFAEPVKA